MPALVAMRFLAPACLALIVLPFQVPSPRRSGQGHQAAVGPCAPPPTWRPTCASCPPAASGVLRHRIRDRHYRARPRTPPAGREDQRHRSKIRSGQELVEGFVIAAPACPGVFRDVLATLGIM
jgi:hypothetical protein